MPPCSPQVHPSGGLEKGCHCLGMCVRLVSLLGILRVKSSWVASGPSEQSPLQGAAAWAFSRGHFPFVLPNHFSVLSQDPQQMSPSAWYQRGRYVAVKFKVVFLQSGRERSSGCQRQKGPRTSVPPQPAAGALLWRVCPSYSSSSHVSQGHLHFGIIQAT